MASSMCYQSKQRTAKQCALLSEAGQLTTSVSGTFKALNSLKKHA